MRELASYTLEKRDAVTRTRVRVTVQVLEDEPEAPAPQVVNTRGYEVVHLTDRRAA